MAGPLLQLYVCIIVRKCWVQILLNEPCFSVLPEESAVASGVPRGVLRVFKHPHQLDFFQLDCPWMLIPERQTDFLSLTGELHHLAVQCLAELHFLIHGIITTVHAQLSTLYFTLPLLETFLYPGYIHHTIKLLLMPVHLSTFPFTPVQLSIFSSYDINGCSPLHSPAIAICYVF